MILFAPILNYRTGGPVPLNVFRRHGFPEHGQALGIAVRERAQEHRFDNAEEGAVGSDGHTENHYRSDSESWGAKQSARSVAQVLEERFQIARLAVYRLRQD